MKRFTLVVMALAAFAFATPATAQLEAKALLSTTVTNTDGLQVGSVDVGGQLVYGFQNVFVGASGVFDIESGGSVLSHEQTSIEVGANLGPVGALGFVGRHDTWDTLGIGVRLGPVGGIMVEGRLNFVEAVGDMDGDGGRSTAFELRLAAF